ncbi:porin [Parapedomonas caeni]
MTVVAVNAAAASPVRATGTSQSRDGQARDSQARDAKASTSYLYFRESDSSISLDPQGPGALKPALIDARQPARAVASPLRDGRARSAERSFLFTPSGKVDRKAFTVGVTSRAAVASAADKTAPTFDVAGYNVGMALGYQGFSVEAGYSRVDDIRRASASAEGVDVGLSYRGKDWKTTLQVAGERYGDADHPTTLGIDKSYSVELGGSYLLTPRLSVNGGVKYQVTHPTAAMRAGESDQVGGTVYLGTNFKF